MHLDVDGNAALTVALALAAGMAAQALVHHLRLPKIVLLLALGALLGPDVANVVQPAALGDGLHDLVGFAIAVILFEGGMSLDVVRLRKEQRSVIRLITVGAGLSLVLAAVAAWLALVWPWQLSLLFGTLVMVTGPTVVTPMLRRLRVQPRVSTVLEAEGVLIDAVGAITATVALDLVLQPSGQSWVLALPTIAGRLAFGAVFGLLGGIILGLLLRFRNVIPEGLANTFALAWALLVFQVANAIVHESGIAAVTVAGMWVGNTHSHVRDGLVEFKEQLTVMLIGMLFVLLVADVRVAEVVALGRPAVVVVLAVILVVRPLSVAVATFRTELSARERLFVAWMGPRGIVAAAVASMFAFRLDEAGAEGGSALRALVFLVIACTVSWSGITGGVAARALGLRQPPGSGWAILGDNPLACLLAQLLRGSGSDVILVDPRPEACSPAGVPLLPAHPLGPQIAKEAGIATRVGAIAAMTSAETNVVIAEKTRRHARGARCSVMVGSSSPGVLQEMVREAGAEVLFGVAIDVVAWTSLLDRGGGVVRWLELRGRPHAVPRPPSVAVPFVPLVHERRRRREPITHRTRLRRGSRAAFLVEAHLESQWLEQMHAAAGWVLCPGQTSGRDPCHTIHLVFE